MKKSVLFLAGLFIALFSKAQNNVVTPPQAPDYNQPGLRLDSIITYLQRGLTAADSGEGGVWKTTDGGKNWHCITDNAPVLAGIISPNKLAVNPTNPDNFYVGSYTYLNHVLRPQVMEYLNGAFVNNANYGHGMLVTNDGGDTWHQEILSLNSNPPWQDTVSGAKPYFAPDGQRVYAFRDKHLFYKQVAGAWHNITPANMLDSAVHLQELKFVPLSGNTYDPNHFFLAAHGNPDLPLYNRAALIECTLNPLTNTYTFTKIPLPVSSVSVYISIPTSSLLYTAFGNALYRLNLSNYNWNFISTLKIPDPNGQGPFYPPINVPVGEAGFEASPANPALLYVNGPISTFQALAYISTDTGKTNMQAMSKYSGDPTHCDVRDFYVHQFGADAAGVQSRVYYANDGGIMMKPANANPFIRKENTCININGKGLTPGKYWGLSSLEKDGTVFAGMQDNFQWSHNPSWAKPWENFGSGDGGEAVASRVKEEAYIGSSGSGYTNYFNQTLRRSNGVFDSVVSSGGFNVRQERINEIIPLWADQYGGYYVGQRNLWRVLPNSDTLVRVSGINVPYPQYDVHLNLHKNAKGDTMPIRCMSFSQYYDSLTGYVMYNDGALFYRNDMTTPAPYTNQFNLKPATGYDTVTKGFAYWNPPTDIVCDPRQPERVWLSLGGVDWNNSHRNRARYSPDAGDHWFDISKGLPNMLPIGKIQYQEGSPYVYAATDAGIYRLDMSTFAYTDINDDMSAYNSVEWTCFNRGDVGNPDFPSINTPALNINYCSGRLYAATDGRGIWSTPLWEPFKVPPITESNLITTNTTWTGTRYLTTGIRIKDGATLTITGTNTQIHLPKDGKIVVEAGAKLVVDGATLTNGCKDCLWGGIVAEGKAHLPQTAANQATVIVQNNALIENARNAITTWGGDISNAGAILNLSNSTFRNNKRSIEFISYHNTLAGRRIGNLSRISRCTFELNDDYRGTGIDYFFTTFISLWDVEGVVISGNSFVNTNTAEANFGNGITSFNAAYRVAAACNSPSNAYPCTAFTRNTFSGLKHGVFAEGDNFTDNTFVVGHAPFVVLGR